MAALDQLEARYQRLLQQRSVLAQRYSGGDLTVSPQIQAINIEIRETLLEIDAIKATGSVTSAGQVTANAQFARDDGANTQNPEDAENILEVQGRIRPGTGNTRFGVTNADQFNTANTEDTGTNEETRKAENLQSIPPPTSGNPISGDLPVGSASSDYAYGNNEMESQNEIFTAPSFPGTAAPSDDQVDTTLIGNSNTRSAINDVFGGQNAVITPQNNVLSGYNSYTYSISIYIMNKSDYSKLLKTKRRYIPSYQLLMQSGGAATSAGAVGAGSPASQAGRNQYFPLDYYIDDLKLRSLIAGKGAKGAHNVFDMSFKIIEPNGVSFLENLVAATKQYAGNGANQNYAAQNYLMVIRFYGYDVNGNLVSADKWSTDTSGLTDKNAITEKFIPFQFTGIKFKLSNNLVEYDCQAVCPQNTIGSGNSRGVIPYNIELTATTLKDLLVGNQTANNSNNTTDNEGREVTTSAQTGATSRQLTTQDVTQTSDGDTAGSETGTTAGQVTTQNQAPPAANSAPNPSISRGLTYALNQFQAELVKKGTFTYPDEYKIVIVEPAIQNAKLTPPGNINKKFLPMTTAQTAAQAKDGAKQSVNNSAKTVSAIAGTSIVQFIDQVTRTSTYIYDQQTKIITDEGKEIPQGTPAEVFAWYRIGMESEPIVYDPKRNDYAYRITYQVNMYKVNDVKSDYFVQSPFKGTHKKYNHWFTGQNTEILDYQQDYNYLYYVVVNAKRPSSTRTANYRDLDKRAFQPRSNQSDQGLEGKINEPSANAADYLYSPADTARVRLNIVGDPAWIQQGELWSGVAGLKFNYGPFLSDGTINFESQEILFEVAFNTPVDYDSGTGLMDPGQKNYGANRAAGNGGDARQSYVYRAIDCTSTFSQGKFTQEINGAQIFFQLPTTTSASQTQQQQNTDVVNVGQNNSNNTDNPGADNQIRTASVSPDETTFSNTDVNQGDGQAMSYTPTGININDTETVDNNANSILQQDNALQTLELSVASPPTSGGQVVGNSDPLSFTDFAGGAGVAEQPVSTQVTLLNGTVETVYSEAEVQTLLNTGQIDIRAANSAILSLQIKTEAQQATSTTYVQRVSRDF